MNQLALPLPGYNPVLPNHAGKHISGYVKKAQQLIQGFTYSPNARADDEKLFNYLLNHAGWRREPYHSVQVDAVLAFLGSHATKQSIADSLWRLTATNIDIAGYEPDPETGEMEPFVGRSAASSSSIPASAAAPSSAHSRPFCAPPSIWSTRRRRSRCSTSAKCGNSRRSRAAGCMNGCR